MLALLCAACSTQVGRGKALCSNGDYIEAAQVFEHGEDALSEMSPKERASYGVYRGATMLALEDTQAAQRWLSYARKQQRQHPGSLSPEESDDLESAWHELMLRINGDAQPTSSRAVAVTPVPAQVEAVPAPKN